MGTNRIYREPRYEFGRQVLALRTRAALTQADLARKIGVHRRSLQNWESSESYPKAETLQRLIEILLIHHAFTPGNEKTEALALWQLAEAGGVQSVGSFDAQWFSQAFAAMGGAPAPLLLDAPKRGTFLDWGEAIAPAQLLGREREIATLQRWIAHEQCRLVAILGMGGMGKSSLAVTFATHSLDEFEFVIFHSLQNGPSLDYLIDQTIRAINHQPVHLPDTLDDKITLLVQSFRQHRCLLILDNFETLLQPGALTGTYRPGYANYAMLLQRLGESDHQSCLLLTGREKPVEIGPLEGRNTPVRTLLLGGLDVQACRLILEAKEIAVLPMDIQRLVNVYAGNPLALNLVSEPILELFGGNVGAFLATGEAYFNGVGNLLEQQFARSTALEQSIMRWLAIVREPVLVNRLLATLGERATKNEILRALESLHRRMQIERVIEQPAFTLQPVIQDYIIEQLSESIYREIVTASPKLLQQHMIVHAAAKEYVRHSQEQLFALPLLQRLIQSYGNVDALLHQLMVLLDVWRNQPMARQQFGPGNVVNLLRLLRGHLRGLNLSGLSIHQAYFRGVDAQDCDLSNVMLNEPVFTEMFGALTALAVDRDGKQWAASSRRGEVLLWQPNDTATYHAPLRVWQAHLSMIFTLAFSPDGHYLATSGGWEGSVKMWDVTQGAFLWVGQHVGHVNTVAFSPNGKILASCGDDASVCLWDASRGTLITRLMQSSAVVGLAWSADGQYLATGDVDGMICFWRVDADAQAHVQYRFVAHGARVDSLAFAPRDNRLASASWDGFVKLWAIPDTDTGAAQLLHSFAGHTTRVVRLAWNNTGDLLASSSYNPTIWLWDTATGLPRQSLNGHRDGVYGLAFMPDGKTLISSSEDESLRVWDVASARSVLAIQGYSNPLYAVDWHPNSKQLVSGGADRTVTIHHRDPSLAASTLYPQPETTFGIVLGVGWSADGKWVAASEWDNLIRLLDAESGEVMQLIRHEQDPINYFTALAWSSDGRLACSSYRHGVLVYDPTLQHQHWLDHQQPTWIRAVAWHRQSEFVAGGDEKGAIYVWRANDYSLVYQLNAHHSEVLCLAWEPKELGGGTRLLSGGLGKAGGELFVWGATQGALLHKVKGHSSTVCAVAWGATPNEFVSGDGEGTLRWWNLARGEMVHVQKAHHGVVQSLARSPDGTSVASCGDDGLIHVWDLKSGERLQTLHRDRPYERMRIAGLRGITPAQRASLLSLGALES